MGEPKNARDVAELNLHSQKLKNLDEKSLFSQLKTLELRFKPNKFHVTKLILSHNLLKAIPPVVFDLENLEHLSLCNNQIETVPNEVSRLQR